MKKTLLTLLMAVVMTAGAMAQEFPDGSFENWTYTDGGYYDYETNMLMTLNALVELNGVEMETYRRKLAEDNNSTMTDDSMTADS